MAGRGRKAQKEKAPGHHPQGQPPHSKESLSDPQDTADIGPAQDFTISTPTGLFRSSVLKLKSGAENLPDPRLQIDAGNVWGVDLWTDEEVRRAILALVASGLSIPRALDRLRQEKGSMPALTTIYAWLKRYEHFAEEMELALAARGDILMDAATESALAANEVTAYPESIRVKHFETLAAKHNKRFEKKTKVEVERREVETLTDEELDRRIAALLSNKDLADSLPPIDVEIIPDKVPAELHLSQDGE